MKGIFWRWFLDFFLLRAAASADDRDAA